MMSHVDFFHPGKNQAQVDVIYGVATTAATGWMPWVKPKGKTMGCFTIWGGGGNGGNGAIGANSTAAGGGGGGSGGQTTLIIPLILLPDILFFRGPAAGFASLNASNLGIIPNSAPNHIILQANSGSNGGNAVGGTVGAAGNPGAVTVIANMPLSQGRFVALAGQIAAAGGTTGVNTALTIPTTGLIVTGGQGGSGLPGPATAGSNSVAFTTPAWPFPAVPLITGPSVATTPPSDGQHGQIIRNSKGISDEVGWFYYGGQGGPSTYGTALTTGLVQASGGRGAPGCGGGGSGGSLTGSAAGIGGLGGAGFFVAVCW